MDRQPPTDPVLLAIYNTIKNPEIECEKQARECNVVTFYFMAETSHFRGSPYLTGPYYRFFETVRDFGTAIMRFIEEEATSTFVTPESFARFKSMNYLAQQICYSRNNRPLADVFKDFGKSGSTFHHFYYYLSFAYQYVRLYDRAVQRFSQLKNATGGSPARNSLRCAITNECPTCST